jgi:hypothetical protein
MINNYFDILIELISSKKYETLYVNYVEEQLFQKNKFDKFMYVFHLVKLRLDNFYFQYYKIEKAIKN